MKYLLLLVLAGCVSTTGYSQCTVTVSNASDTIITVSIKRLHISERLESHVAIHIADNFSSARASEEAIVQQGKETWRTSNSSPEVYTQGSVWYTFSYSIHRKGWVYSTKHD